MGMHTHTAWLQRPGSYCCTAQTKPCAPEHTALLLNAAPHRTLYCPLHPTLSTAPYTAYSTLHSPTAPRTPTAPCTPLFHPALPSCPPRSPTPPRTPIAPCAPYCTLISYCTLHSLLHLAPLLHPALLPHPALPTAPCTDISHRLLSPPGEGQGGGSILFTTQHLRAFLTHAL